MMLYFNPTPGFGPIKTADTFGPYVRPGGHTGWDNRAPYRSKIYPAAPGVVYAIPKDDPSLPKERRGCGHGVRIRHDLDPGRTSSYCHFDVPTTLRIGDRVEYDTVLGLVGSTGNAYYPHLHHSHEVNGVRRDPATILEGSGLVRDPWPGFDYEPPPILDRITVDRPRLRRGSEGRPVEDLQSLLNVLGDHLVIDGKFGPITEAAVKGYQGSRGLTQDGIVGMNTWTALLDY